MNMQNLAALAAIASNGNGGLPSLGSGWNFFSKSKLFTFLRFCLACWGFLHRCMGGITSFAWNWLFFLYKFFCIYIFGCVVFFYQLFRTETSLFPWRRPTGLQLSVSNFPFSLFLFFASSLEKWSKISSSCREIFLYFAHECFVFLSICRMKFQKKKEKERNRHVKLRQLWSQDRRPLLRRLRRVANERPQPQVSKLWPAPTRPASSSSPQVQMKKKNKLIISLLRRLPSLISFLTLMT